MTSHLVAVTFDVHDADDVASFWAGLLDRPVVHEEGAALLPWHGDQVGLRFVTSSSPRQGRNRLHLHVTSESLDDQRRVVDSALGRGATHFDAGQLPDEPHVVLADPGGNEFCVIEPDNAFLAGCGRLGEVACDGGPHVGRFWRAALDWPFVWEHADETAVQSPAGGTKISWGGTPPRRNGRSRQRFDLVTADPQREAERLVAAGATLIGERDGGLELGDPDGHEFWLGQA